MPVLQANRPLRELRELAKGMTKQLPDVVQKATAKIDEWVGRAQHAHHPPTIYHPCPPPS